MLVCICVCVCVCVQVIMFGFVAMFSVAFPFAPLLAALSVAMPSLNPLEFIPHFIAKIVIYFHQNNRTGNSLTPSRTHSPSRSPTRSRTHPPTLSLTNYIALILPPSFVLIEVRLDIVKYGKFMQRAITGSTTGIGVRACPCLTSHRLVLKIIWF